MSEVARRLGIGRSTLYRSSATSGSIPQPRGFLQAAISAAMRFNGKSVLITGAASGIGLATAELVAREGAARIISIDLAKASWTPPDCEIICHVGDVASEQFWANVSGQARSCRDQCRSERRRPDRQFDFAEWRRIFSVNLDGAFLSLRRRAQHLRRRIDRYRGLGGRAEGGAWRRRLRSIEGGLIQLTKVAAKEASASEFE